MELIPNGVDTTRFAPGGGRRGPTEPTRILYVGRLSAEKNLAASSPRPRRRRRRSGGPSTLTWWARARCEATSRLRRGGSASPSSFPAWWTSGDLPAVYGAADVFVLPSFTEGHPKALIEAMGCGLPCVVSNCGGNRPS